MATHDGAGMTRRDLFRVGVGAATATAAGAAGPAHAQEEFDYGGWFEDANNYDGTVDATGEDEVVVEVGAGDNGLAFAPPAIHVDAGTTVVFEWTGAGGVHNVTERESGQRYESDLAGETGTRYPLTFESDGISKYVCTPHASVGMKGAIVVGSGEGVSDVSVGEMSTGGSGSGGDGSEGSESGSGEDSGSDGSGGSDEEAPPAMQGDNGVFALFGLSAVVAFLSPFAVILLMRRDDTTEA